VRFFDICKTKYQALGTKIVVRQNLNIKKITKIPKYHKKNPQNLGPSMTPRKRLMTPLGVMTRSLGTTALVEPYFPIALFPDVRIRARPPIKN
jgi:hypothetical protein